MKAEVTAIIEAASKGGFWAICPEFPGANGQGETIEGHLEKFKVPAPVRDVRPFSIG